MSTYIIFQLRKKNVKASVIDVLTNHIMLHSPDIDEIHITLDGGRVYKVCTSSDPFSWSHFLVFYLRLRRRVTLGAGIVTSPEIPPTPIRNRFNGNTVLQRSGIYTCHGNPTVSSLKALSI